MVSGQLSRWQGKAMQKKDEGKERTECRGSANSKAATTKNAVVGQREVSISFSWGYLVVYCTAVRIQALTYCPMADCNRHFGPVRVPGPWPRMHSITPP